MILKVQKLKKVRTHYKSLKFANFLCYLKTLFFKRNLKRKSKVCILISNKSIAMEELIFFYVK